MTTARTVGRWTLASGLIANCSYATHCAGLRAGFRLPESHRLGYTAVWHDAIQARSPPPAIF